MTRVDVKWPTEAYGSVGEDDYDGIREYYGPWRNAICPICGDVLLSIPHLDAFKATFETACPRCNKDFTIVVE